MRMMEPEGSGLDHVQLYLSVPEAAELLKQLSELLRDPERRNTSTCFREMAAESCRFPS